MLRRLFHSVRYFPLLAAWLGCALAVVLFFAGLRRGFDFTDEGSYYLSFAHPESVADKHTSYFLFGSAVFSLLGSSIAGMRLFTFLLITAGAAIFLQGWLRLVRELAPELAPGPERLWLIRAGVFASTFLAYAISPVSLSYNFQNAFCLLAACGLLFAAVARPPPGRLLDLPTLGALAGFGVLVGAEFFVKFSSSVVLAVAGAGLFLVAGRLRPAQKAAALAVLLGCAVAIVLAFFAFLEDFDSWWKAIEGLRASLFGSSYVANDLRRYAAETTDLFKTTLQDFVPAWLVLAPATAALWLLRRRPRARAAVAAAGGAALCLALGRVLAAQRYDIQMGGDGLPFFLGALLVVLLLALAARIAGRRAVPAAAARRRCWRILLAAGFLLCLPYIGAFGTTNDIAQNCDYQLAPWFAFAALSLAILDSAWGTAWPGRLGLLGLTAMACAQFRQGYWVDPYRAANLSTQTVLTTLGDPPTRLRLDPATSEFIDTCRRILRDHGFVPGGDLIVLFDLPGFVYAMDGVSPGHQWYYAGDQAALDQSRMYLGLIPPERRTRAFVVRNGDWYDVLAVTRQAGLNFPDDYELITPPMVSPFTQATFEIWKPKALRP